MKLRRLIPLVVAIFAVSTITQTIPALAQAPTPQTVGIRLVDAPTSRVDDPRAHQYIIDHIPPGTTITRRVEVSNDTATTQLVQLYPGAATISNGSFLFGDGRAVNDLTTWTTVDPPTVSPSSGSKSLATVTIAVPIGASPGERYAVVWAELPAAIPAGGGIRAVNRVGVRIYLSVGTGGDPASDFAITTFEARRDPMGNPLVAATVQNTGGRAVDLSGQLMLANGPGGLSAGPFTAKLGATLGIGQTEPVLISLDRAIPAGPWDASIVLRSGLTERQATATITFPAAVASSSGPVATRAAAQPRSPLVLIVVGVLLLGGLIVGSIVFIRRRRARSVSVT